MQAITNLRDAANTLKRGTDQRTVPSGSAQGGGATGDSAGASASGQLKRGQRSLDLDKPSEPELRKPAPRAVKASGVNTHKHFTVAVALPTIVGSICLMLFAIGLGFNWGPYPWWWLIGGLAALSIAGLLNPALRCHCSLYKWLVHKGTAVSAQISEKRVVTRAGQRQYFLDYAFNEEGAQQNSWGSMQVNADQYSSVAEGDVVSIVYLNADDGVDSCIYRFCPFRAII
jgi:hypothetical protein